jgi:hypothetical protein
MLRTMVQFPVIFPKAVEVIVARPIAWHNVTGK